MRAPALLLFAQSVIAFNPLLLKRPQGSFAFNQFSPGSYDIRENHVYPNYNTDRKQTYRPKLIEMLMFAGQYQQVNSIPYQSTQILKYRKS